MNQMKISFKSNLVNEVFARNAVGAFILYLNPTIDDLIEIKTIVSEAVTNAIVHGYNQDPHQDVYLSVSIQNHSILIEVEDHGCGIENIQQATLPLYTSKPSQEHAGMGLSIIETLCDDFEIESSLNIGTKLIMKKSLNHEK